jgi:hypothetical protein
MRRLATRIETELKDHEFCAIYNSELAHVFPLTISATKRKERIRRFAKDHRLGVTFYEVGLCAVFEKTSQSKSQVRPSRRQRKRDC